MPSGRRFGSTSQSGGSMPGSTIARIATIASRVAMSSARGVATTSSSADSATKITSTSLT